MDRDLFGLKESESKGRQPFRCRKLVGLQPEPEWAHRDVQALCAPPRLVSASRR